MSGVPTCRKSSLVHANCDNCGVRPEVIHKTSEPRGACYCADCCPVCRAKQAAEKSVPATVRRFRSAAPVAAPPRESPNEKGLAAVLRAGGLDVKKDVVYGPAGLQEGLTIAGHFHPTWELAAKENLADVAVFDFAAIRARRGPGWTIAPPHLRKAKGK